MKSILVSFLFATALFSCKSSDKKPEQKAEQKTVVTDDQSAIRKLMDEYNQAFLKTDWDALLELIHPGAFEVIPRNKYKEALETSFNGQGYTIRLKNMSVDSIGPIIDNKGDKYSVVNITVSSNMTLNQTAPAAICDQMKQDPSVISCSSDSNVVNFSMHDKCYAIYVADKQKWYFISKNEQSKPIADKVIPKEVGEKLGY